MRNATTSTPGRHRKQDMPHPDALSGAVARRVRRVVAPARLFRRLGQLSSRSSQRLDGRGRGFADHAVVGRGVARIEQAGLDGGLAQQLGAGALAQLFGVQISAAADSAARR